MTIQKTTGLDIGTTNCAIATVTNGRLVEHSIPGEGQQLPSTVYWNGEAQPQVGSVALRTAFKQPDALHSHFKRRMYDEPENPAYGGHTAIELFAALISALLAVIFKIDPSAKQYLDGTKPREEHRLVLTHPAEWGVSQIDSLKKAAELAGVQPDVFMPEPEAAAYRLIEEKSHQIRQNDHIAVIDFGGGTLDLTVHKWTSGILQTVVGATGDALLGGDNITGLIFQHFDRKLNLKLGDCFDPHRGLNLSSDSLKSHKKRKEAIELWRVAAEAKEQLSTSDTATVFFNGGKGLEELVLSKEEYFELTADVWQRFQAALSRMLGDSGLTWKEIQHVFLVGGSSIALGVFEKTAEATGKPIEEISVSDNASHVVASGAALAAYTGDEGDRHVARGLGIRLVESQGSSQRYVNKMLLPTNTIVKSGGEVFQDSGQLLHSSGGRSRIRLQFSEARAGVTVPTPSDGIPVLLDDSEVNRLQEVIHDIELPVGQHKVQVSFSFSRGSMFYHLGFEDHAIEGLSGQLVSDGSVAGDSKADHQPIDLAILFDCSGSMAGVKLQNAVAALENVVQQTVNTDVRTALITFGSHTGLLCPFGSQADEMLLAIRQLRAANGTPMTEAFEAASQELQGQRPDSHKLAIVLTDGHPHNAVTAESSANNLKSVAELVCFGIGGSGVDEGYLSRLATSPEHYFYTDDPTKIPTLFDSILELFLN